MRKPAKILFLLLFPMLTKAQNNPVLGTGNITSATISGQTVEFVTEHAQGELTVCSPAVIRVMLDKKKLEKDFSYAVISRFDPQGTVTGIEGTKVRSLTTGNVSGKFAVTY